MPKDTSWGSEAGWYRRMLAEEGEYQREVILPNLLRLMDIKEGERVLDLACGEGFFAREFAKRGARVVGVDISKELIGLAKQHSPKSIEFHAAPAHALDFLGDGTVGKTALIFALQNIENVHEVIRETGRVLGAGAPLFIVMTHPAFRVPQESSWGWDETQKMQYRRIDRYLSEARVKIQMHPGRDPQATTITFHRPLQFYFKSLSKNGFCVRRLEEWISHKKSQLGPRAKAENAARTEIPLFIALEAFKT